MKHFHLVWSMLTTMPSIKSKCSIFFCKIENGRHVNCETSIQKFFNIKHLLPKPKGHAFPGWLLFPLLLILNFWFPDDFCCNANFVLRIFVSQRTFVLRSFVSWTFFAQSLARGKKWRTKVLQGTHVILARGTNARKQKTEEWKSSSPISTKYYFIATKIELGTLLSQEAMFFIVIFTYMK